MKHLTFLVGAGASAEELPVNNLLIDKLKEIITVGKTSHVNMNENEYFILLDEVFSSVLELAGKERSIDTLATITTDSKLLDKIKIIIWVFFSISAGNGNIDKRIKKLLARLRDDNSKNFALRDNVSFVSWNYDLQFEEALAKICDMSIEEASGRFKIFPGVDYVSPHKFSQNRNNYDYRLVHLNGCAGYYYDKVKSTGFFWGNKDIKKLEFYEQMLRKVIELFFTNGETMSNTKCSIGFAHEKNDFQHQSLEFSKNIARKTTDLVIIGYSFPDFNRKIDRILINEMANLKYLCIQDKDPESIKTKLLGMGIETISKLDPSKIICENNYHEFHIPSSFL